MNTEIYVLFTIYHLSLYNINVLLLQGSGVDPNTKHCSSSRKTGIGSTILKTGSDPNPEPTLQKTRIDILENRTPTPENRIQHSRKPDSTLQKTGYDTL